MRKFKVTIKGVSYDVTVEEYTNENVSAQAAVAAKEPERKEEVVSSNAPAVGEEKTVPTVSKNVGDGEMIKAPMPGTVVKVAVSVGESVNSGDMLLVLEAMKMENEIFSPVSGKVTSVSVSQGTNVNSGDVLLTIA